MKKTYKQGLEERKSLLQKYHPSNAPQVLIERVNEMSKEEQGLIEEHWGSVNMFLLATGMAEDFICEHFPKWA